MALIPPLFETRLWRAELADTPKGAALIEALDDACRAVADDDEAGQAWSEAHGYRGYTSYASLNDLTWRDPSFEALKKRLDKEAAAYAEALELDLKGRKLKLDSLWINVLEPGGTHSGHIHPHSVISGTCYVAVPAGASALKLEDPRLPLMMAHPPRRADASPAARTFVYLEPKPGTVLMWESFLRHEVPPNAAEDVRISVSFNYGWG